MRDGKDVPRSVKLITATCDLSGKRILPEIVTTKDKAIRLRGKKRINTCVVLKSALEEIIGVFDKRCLIKTSKEDFEKSLVSFVLPVESLSPTQKSVLQKSFTKEYRRVFY